MCGMGGVTRERCGKYNRVSQHDPASVSKDVWRETRGAKFLREETEVEVVCLPSLAVPA